MPVVMVALAAALIGQNAVPSTVVDVEHVKVYAVPIPMSIVEDRLGIRKPNVGYWNIHLHNGTSREIKISGPEIVMAISEWAALLKQPQPLFLTKDQAWPIIARRSGSKWKHVVNAAGLAGVAVAIAGFSPAAAAQPVLSLLGAQAANQVPDISTVNAELPATISLPAGGGLTVSTWSAKMRSAPSPIGPIRVSVQGGGLSGGLSAQVPHSSKYLNSMYLSDGCRDLYQFSVRREGVEW